MRSRPTKRFPSRVINIHSTVYVMAANKSVVDRVNNLTDDYIQKVINIINIRNIRIQFTHSASIEHRQEIDQELVEFDLNDIDYGVYNHLLGETMRLSYIKDDSGKILADDV